jgi:hypothetical protein
MMQMPPSRDPLYNRVRNLPGQLERARRRVLQLEAEARRYGMTDLLKALP